MEYQLELNTQASGSNIVFHNLIFKPFKINIIERYHEKPNLRKQPLEVIFKVRSPDDVLIECKNGNKRVILKNETLTRYISLSRLLNSYEYRNKLLDRKEVEQQIIDFFLLQLIKHYEL